VREHVEELKNRTIPPGGKIIANSNPNLGHWSATANWEFEADWSEREYRRWIIAQLHRGFGDPRMIKSRLVFLGRFNGDVETLTVGTTPGSSKLQVRVTLEIYPY